MRFLFLTVLVLVTSVSFSQSSSTETDPLDSIFKLQFPKVYAQIDHPFPSFEFKGQNKIINNNSIKGKVVFINFWFEGCVPCMAEMDGLNQLYQKFKDNKNFEFVSVSKDDDAAIKRVKNKYRLSFNVYSSTEKDCKRLSSGSGYPTSIIIDKTGVIKFIHVGGVIEKEDASDRIMTVYLSEIKSLL